jgi:SAM-dependent methyltransferase
VNGLVRRGGQPNLEIAHAKELLASGAEDVWGWNTPAGQERVKARIRWFKEICNLGPGLEVLECGCGTGMFTRHLAETGAHITAVDISPVLIEEAHKFCPKNVTFIRTNLEDPWELPEKWFDIICGVSVLHHLVLPKTLIALKAKLKPGAQFAFSEPNLLNPINKYIIFTADPERRRRLGVSPAEMAFYPAELRSLFEEAGYEVLGLEHRDFLHPSIPESLIPLARIGQLLAERTPLVRRWSGSLWIHGIKR